MRLVDIQRTYGHKQLILSPLPYSMLSTTQTIFVPSMSYVRVWTTPRFSVLPHNRVASKISWRTSAERAQRLPASTSSPICILIYPSAWARAEQNRLEPALNNDEPARAYPQGRLWSQSQQGTRLRGCRAEVFAFGRPFSNFLVC